MLLVGLPVSVWLDLRDISETLLRRQTTDLDRIVTDIRGFYASDVVARVMSNNGRTMVSAHYETIPGAIPIPATFSLKLGQVIDENQGNIGYRFVSDFPFRGRAAHELDAFERDALRTFRNGPERRRLYDVAWNGLDNRVRLVAPVIMSETCVACHNAHPDSPKRDWKIGDVRGIQEVAVTQPIVTSLFSFRYLLVYFGFSATLGTGFIVLQRRQAALISRINERLGDTNAFLQSIATKIARYISPQIYKRIFSGDRDVTIATERKKLTIFFSDIKDFTSTADRLQPEELTALLNEYFTEMATIALRYGGTVDKFIGDAMLVFFGDPETLGIDEDARQCVRMAVEMQRRIGELDVVWRDRGVENPFVVRMGINTGYCDVGNFGSADRMDYTIIGGEANLAARLQAAAAPGTIVMSYETYAHVRAIVDARRLAPIVVKGIAREIVPYEIESLREVRGLGGPIIAEHVAGLDLVLDPTKIAGEDSERARAILREALAALDA
ncbi:MAG: adenylate/guanylate cyclase domain-containing protein [Vulcanimicrobiaceae bacterium]